MSTILQTVKEFIGPSSSYDVFDPQLKMDINTALFKLYQLGVGDKPFVVTSGEETWSELYDGDDLEIIKTIVCLNTRVLFDPPTNSSLLNAMNEQIKEYESRLNYEVDPKIE